MPRGTLLADPLRAFARIREKAGRHLADTMGVVTLRAKISNKWNRLLAKLEKPILSDPAAEAFEPLERDGMRAECLAAWPGDELVKQWEGLADRVPGATPFARAIWRRAVAPAGAVVRVFTVHRGPELVAVLPMVVAGDAVLTPGAAVSDDLDPLVCEEAWPILLELAGRLWDRRMNEFVLHNVREGHGCRVALTRVAGELGFSYQEDVVEQAPYLVLPKTWDELLEGIDAHERREFRRRLRKAEAQGGAKLVACGTASDAESMLRTALDILEKGHAEKSVAVREVLRPFLLDVGPKLIAAGQLQVKLMHVEDRPAACLLQFAGSEGPMLYNCGFDPELKQWSPGSVAVCMAIREAIEGGAKVYDFLRGRESYKYRLGAKDRGLYRITVRK